MRILFAFRPSLENYFPFIQAARISRRMKAELVIMQSTEVDEEAEHSLDRLKSEIARQRYEAIAKLLAWEETYLKQIKHFKSELNLKYHYKFMLGSYTENLSRLMRRGSFDLILFANDLPEKTFQDIIRKSNSSVIVLPADIDTSQFGCIVLAADFNTINPNSEMLDWIHTFASSLAVPVHFLHINIDSGKDSISNSTVLQTLETVSNELQGSVIQLSGEDKWARLLSHLQSMDNPLLALVKRHTGPLAGLFQQSITSKMELFSDRPVLVVNQGSFIKK